MIALHIVTVQQICIQQLSMQQQKQQQKCPSRAYMFQNNLFLQCSLPLLKDLNTIISIRFETSMTQCQFKTVTIPGLCYHLRPVLPFQACVTIPDLCCHSRPMLPFQTCATVPHLCYRSRSVLLLQIREHISIYLQMHAHTPY